MGWYTDDLERENRAQQTEEGFVSWSDAHGEARESHQISLDLFFKKFFPICALETNSREELRKSEKESHGKLKNSVPKKKKAKIMNAA